MGCGASVPPYNGPLPPPPIDWNSVRPAGFKPRERRVKLVIQDPPHLRGSGLKLEASDVDATYTHRAFHLRIGSASEAIEVAFAAAGGCVCVWGHHTLGYTLDNWYG